MFSDLCHLYRKKVLMGLKMMGLSTLGPVSLKPETLLTIVRHSNFLAVEILHGLYALYIRVYDVL